MNTIELQPGGDFQSVVVGASHQQPVVAVLWAAWCGPCKLLKPKLATVQAKYGFHMVRIDAEKHRAVCEKLKVRSIPSVLVFNRGEVVGRFNGDKTEADITTILMKAGAFQMPLL